MQITLENSEIGLYLDDLYFKFFTSIPKGERLEKNAEFN